MHVRCARVTVGTGMAEGKTVSHSENQHDALGKSSLNGGEREACSRLQQFPVQPCPSCHSQRLYRDGLRYLADGSAIQRWLCRDCSHRFSEPKVKVDVAGKIDAFQPGSELLKNGVVPSKLAIKKSGDSLSLSVGENVVANHELTTAGKGLNSFAYKDCKCQVCATQGAKNLETATETKTVAGDVKAQDVKGKLLEFAFHMQKNGLSQKTIETFINSLKKLEKSGANLLDPENVKETLAKLKSSQNSKATIKGAYSGFLRFLGLSWKPPKIHFEAKIPFIPLESEIDSLIAGCGKTTSVLLQLLKETGMRIGEALRLKWTDINTENNTVILNLPEKHCNPRIFRVSPKLIGMLQAIPKKSERIFNSPNERHRQHIFKTQRDKLANKLGNPRLKQITFHTLRHWKATIEYHKTHDQKHVQMLLGHRSILSTDRYITIEQAIFNDVNDEYHVKTAANIEEACRLLEVGFEYVTDMEGKKLFRKRK
jgi:integrase/recombinase XerD